MGALPPPLQVKGVRRAAMSQFLGTHQNRLDAKGRVSIPAPFRAALRAGSHEDGPVTVYLAPSHKYRCIEGWSKKKFAAMALRLESMDPLTDEYDDLAATLYADAYEVESDKEGRVLLAGSMVAYAGLTDQVAFMGMGDKFQIWEPDAAKTRREEARSAARARELARSAKAAA